MAYLYSSVFRSWLTHQQHILKRTQADRLLGGFRPVALDTPLGTPNKCSHTAYTHKCKQDQATFGDRVTWTSHLCQIVAFTSSFPSQANTVFHVPSSSLQLESDDLFIHIVGAYSGIAGSTLRSSQAVPHPSTNRALRRLTSEVGRDPVHSTRYGRQQRPVQLDDVGLLLQSDLLSLDCHLCTAALHLTSLPFTSGEGHTSLCPARELG